MGTLASQAEIGVWVQALRESGGGGCITHGNILRWYTQIPAFFGIRKHFNSGNAVLMRPGSLSAMGKTAFPLEMTPVLVIIRNAGSLFLGPPFTCAISVYF